MGAEAEAVVKILIGMLVLFFLVLKLMKMSLFGFL